MSTEPASFAEGADSTLRRLRQVCEEVAEARERAAGLTAVRDSLVVALAAAGMPYADLADASGLTPGRVAQLVARSRRTLD